jgi:hypothetical protein
VYVKGLEEPHLFEMQETFLENSFPQPEHMWIMKNGEVMEISGNSSANSMYHDIKSNFLSKPFYLYKLENNLHNKYYLAKFDKDADYSNLDKLVDVF